MKKSKATSRMHPAGLLLRRSLCNQLNRVASGASNTKRLLSAENK
jgi:hypothetical protein